MRDVAREADIAIVGGGLAGLTLALQLRREVPAASVTVVDRSTRPLPEGAFKVGESTVEIGAFYLGELLGLRSCLEDRHLVKHGLRFFFQSARGSFARRPEFGLVDYPPFDSYQLDRGRLESDLRALVGEAGAQLLEGWTVEGVSVGTGTRRHGVDLARPDGHRETIEARWVVDASGRRRMLQRTLGLEEKGEQPCSASWFRVRGRLDVERFVPMSESAWHARVPPGRRYYSTCHLMGDGYWVWLIALPCDATSVGIVARHDMHPIDAYNTLSRARAWVATHEPTLGEALQGREVLDFLTMHRYSYTSQQVLSADRWACVGDAAFFSDPLYSPGTDMIGFGNTIVAELIRKDRRGTLAEQDVAHYDRWLRTLNDLLTRNLQAGYPFFGKAVPMAAKILWEVAVTWSYVAPQMFNLTFVAPKRAAAVRKATSRLFFLQDRMQRLFTDWGARPAGRLSFRFFRYLELPFMRDLRSRNLQAGKSMDELVRDQKENMHVLEELAEALFRVAVEDVLPEQLSRLDGHDRLNVWAIGLHPDRWEADGLFRPDDGEPTGRRVYEAIRAQLGRSGSR